MCNCIYAFNDRLVKNISLVMSESYEEEKLD